MDVVLFSILLLTAGINLILTILILKHFVRTRYTPSLILALFFISKGLLDWIFLPVAWLDTAAVDIIIPIERIAVIIACTTPLLLLIFFESVFGNPLSKNTAPCIAYYGASISYALTQELNVVYMGARGWTMVYTNEYQLVLGGYMLLIYFLVLARLILSIRSGRAAEKTDALEIERVSMLGINKLVVLWLVGFLLGQAGVLINQSVPIENLGYVVAIIGIFLTSFSYLYDPHAFFLSSAEIQSILFFDAGSGVSFLAFGLEMDDNLAAGGLLGSLTLQQQIMGTKKYPTLQVFGDKVFLLAYEKVGETLVGGAVLMNRYLHAMYPTLNRALHVFTTKNRSSLEKWKGGGERLFDHILPELLSIFSFAWSKEKRAEIKQLTVAKRAQ